MVKAMVKKRFSELKRLRTDESVNKPSRERMIVLKTTKSNIRFSTNLEQTKFRILL